MWPADECQAIRIAMRLSRREGAKALDRARRRHRDAIARRDVLAADLYRAVCTILEDRRLVFSSSRNLRMAR